jgi:PhnB protein
MQVEPYLNFEGRCEEAIEFYKKAIGAKVEMIMRNEDVPEPHPDMPPGSGKKILHSAFRVGDSKINATDGFGKGAPRFEGITLSLGVADEAEAKRRFNALADGGKATMPLAKTFFSPSFGMLVDRFGVSWMVIVPQAMG